MDQQVRFEGIEIKMAGTVYVVPPLSLKQFKESKQAIDSVGQAQGNDDVYTIMSPVILTALRRNYPNMTEQEFDEMVDLGNFRQLQRAVLSLTGLVESNPSAVPLESPKPVLVSQS